MQIHRALLACVLLVPSGLAHAQGLYKCLDAQGHAKYGQSRCHNDAPAPKPAAPLADTPAPSRTEKLAPGTRAPGAPAAKPDASAEKPLTDSMGRPDVTQMS